MATYTFNFGIPVGETGEKGATGPEGPVPTFAQPVTNQLPVNDDGTSKSATVNFS